MLEQDYTPSGLKIEGPWENDRNTLSKDLFKAVFKEVFNADESIIGHHLIYVYEDKREDGFTYQVVQEIPSADTLIFDHTCMQKVFGDCYKDVLMKLACEPAETRDKLFAELYYSRHNCPVQEAK
jgi:hypothetical protein